MLLSFTVPRRPVSINQAYRRRGGPNRGFYMSSAGRDYKDVVRMYALAAAKSVGWPKPDCVKKASIEITTFNTRHDADAAAKLTCDALEGILYENDRVIQGVTCRKAKDGGKVRVTITVEIP